MMAVFRTAVEPLEDGRETLFAGWFGPIGIAALFYATVAHRLLGIELVWTVVSLVVASSVAVHGVTATPGTKLYGHLAPDAGTQPERSDPDGTPLADE